MGSGASVEQISPESLEHARQEYDRLSAAGESEEAIFASLRDLIAHQVGKPTESESLSPREVESESEHKDLEDKSCADPEAAAAPLASSRFDSTESFPDVDSPDHGDSSDSEATTAADNETTAHDDATTDTGDAHSATLSPTASELALISSSSSTSVGSQAVTGQNVIKFDLSSSSSPRGHDMARGVTLRNGFDLTQNLTPVFTTDVLTDPVTLKLCITFAERNKIPHGVDLLRFWVEIDELQQLPSHSYTHRRLRKIYDKFLSPEAQSPVCVTGAMLTEIERQLEGDNISAGMYAEAQTICFVALERSVYPRFRDSKLFRKMQDFCAPAASGTPGAGTAASDMEDYSLLGVLNHPAKLQFLKSFCMEALALENLLFYLEVEDCKRLPNLSFITNKTRKIYDRYCCPSSKNFICIDDAALSELHAAVESKAALLPKLFYEAQVVVFERISNDIWRAFCRTHEYLEHSKHQQPETMRRRTVHKVTYPSDEQTALAQKRLEGMSEVQLIERAMHYPVEKLIPIKYQQMQRTQSISSAAMLQTSTHDADALRSVLHAVNDELSPHDMLELILGDSIAKKYFLQFMRKRGVEQLVAFCAEVDEFKLLPGIEYLQHSARKIYRKYMMPSAKLQVDMSTAMRDEIFDRLANPSVDMFKKIAARVRHGMLQDSLLRFVKSPQYADLKRATSKQAHQSSSSQLQASPHASGTGAGSAAHLESELKHVDAAAKRGKLELAHLDIVLTHQASVRQFRAFLETQHCSENLLLWEEIEHFRRLPSYQIVLRTAKKIYDKYLSANNARMAIALTPALRQRVVAHLESASRTTFDEVERECVDVMRSVVVPDFLDSRIFMTLVGAWSVVAEDLPAEMLRGELEMAFLRHRFHLVQETKGLSRDTATPLPASGGSTGTGSGTGGTGGTGSGAQS